MAKLAAIGLFLALQLIARTAAAEPYVLQIIPLPATPDHVELSEGKFGLRGVRVHLTDDSWVKLADCGDGLCAEPLDRPPPAARLPKGALPGAMLAHAEGTLRQAWLAEPVDRLGLVAASEAGRLIVIDRISRRHELELAVDAALVGPHLQIADADGDGEDEIIVAIGRQGEGISLAVAQLRDGGIGIVAQTGEKDIPHRAVASGPVADLDGDGRAELAFVADGADGEGSLEIWRFRDGSLEQVGALPDFASRAKDGAAWAGVQIAADLTGDKQADLVVPTADRLTLRIVSIVDDELTESERIALPAEAVTEILMLRMQGRPRPALLVGLADGTLALAR